MQNENHSSSTPSQPSSPTAPKNAFTPEFLHKLETREDPPLAAIEAELRGPWQVVELPLAAHASDGSATDRERWAVLRTWEDPAKDKPTGTFQSREHALLGAAALEVASRGSDLGVGLSQDEHGHAVEEWLPDKGLETVGHFAVWDQDAIAAMRVLGSLLRVPEALARVIDAGSGPIAELIGRRLVGE